jgi:hypothetical protein
MLSGPKVFVPGDEVRLKALLNTNAGPDGQKGNLGFSLLKIKF